MLTDHRLVSIPTTLMLVVLIVTRGADLGIKALYVVVAVFFVSLAMFFAGPGLTPSHAFPRLIDSVTHGDPFFKVFAICFPAFTGICRGARAPIR